MKRRPNPATYPDWNDYWSALCDWLKDKYAHTYPAKGAK